MPGAPEGRRGRPRRARAGAAITRDPLSVRGMGVILLPSQVALAGGAVRRWSSPAQRSAHGLGLVQSVSDSYPAAAESFAEALSIYRAAGSRIGPR